MCKARAENEYAHVVIMVMAICHKRCLSCPNGPGQRACGGLNPGRQCTPSGDGGGEAMDDGVLTAEDIQCNVRLAPGSTVVRC